MDDHKDLQQNDGRFIEVYVNDVTVKALVERDHIEDLEKVFNRLTQFIMHLNPLK